MLEGAAPKGIDRVGGRAVEHLGQLGIGDERELTNLVLGEPDALHQIDRSGRMLQVVGGEGVIEGGWMQGVGADRAKAERADLAQPRGIGAPPGHPLARAGSRQG